MVKSEEVKLERDDDPVSVGPFKEDSKEDISDGERTGKKKAVEPVVQNTISSCSTKKRNNPIWFSLVASNEGNTKVQLRQISPTYIRVKNSYMQLSYLKKYVAKKLDLKTEDEVELYLDNEPLDSSTMLFDLWERWISTKKDVDMMNFEAGSSSAGHVMVVNYDRNVDI